MLEFHMFLNIKSIIRIESDSYFHMSDDEFLIREKADSIILYAQFLNTNYTEAKAICKILIDNYPYFEETFKSIVWILINCKKHKEKDILYIIELYEDFIKFFPASEFRMVITIAMAEYLLSLNLPDGDVDFIRICENVGDHLKILSPNSTDLIEKLSAQRQKNIYYIIENCATSSQFVFSLRQCVAFIESPKTDTKVKISALLLIINIYEAMDLFDLCIKYIKMLISIDQKLIERLPIYIKNKYLKL